MKYTYQKRADLKKKDMQEQFFKLFNIWPFNNNIVTHLVQCKTQHRLVMMLWRKATFSQVFLQLRKEVIFRWSVRNNTAVILPKNSVILMNSATVVQQAIFFSSMQKATFRFLFVFLYAFSVMVDLFSIYSINTMSLLC